MTRITNDDLGGMLSRLQRNMHTHHMLAVDDVLLLAHGSKTNGNSYRLTCVSHGQSPFGTFHWGFTARDCYDRMHAMCVALEAPGFI